MIDGELIQPKMKKWDSMGLNQQRFEGMFAVVSPANVAIYCGFIQTNGGLNRDITDITNKNGHIEGLGF